jgi:hypothetical protein
MQLCLRLYALRRIQTGGYLWWRRRRLEVVAVSLPFDVIMINGPTDYRIRLTPLLLLTLLCAASCGLVSGAAAGELNNTAPIEQRPFLLYIPMHVSEPFDHLHELCDCTLSKDPWVAGSGSEQKDEKNIIDPLAFDILLVVSGPSDATRNATERFGVMRSMLEAATGNLLPSPPRIFSDFKTVGVDRYNLAEEDKDAEWVSGLNSVFYDAFAEGSEIYEKYVRFYALVQQTSLSSLLLLGTQLHIATSSFGSRLGLSAGSTQRLRRSDSYCGFAPPRKRSGGAAPPCARASSAAGGATNEGRLLETKWRSSSESLSQWARSFERSTFSGRGGRGRLRRRTFARSVAGGYGRL